MEQLKYVKEIDDTSDALKITLNELGSRRSESTRKKMVLTLFEFFNDGKYVSESDITISGNSFTVSKNDYPYIGKTKKKQQKTKTLSIRVTENMYIWLLGRVESSQDIAHYVRQLIFDKMKE
jgi:hypothetical protein